MVYGLTAMARDELPAESEAGSPYHIFAAYHTVLLFPSDASRIV